MKTRIVDDISVLFIGFLLGISLTAVCGNTPKIPAAIPKRDFGNVKFKTNDVGQAFTDTNTVTVQISIGAAQELLLGTSAALNPTAPIPIPDNPACRTTK